MSWNQRPSRREIDKKIAVAKSALSQDRAYFAPDNTKLVGELMDLGIGDTEELWSFVLELLEEIKIDDYAGSRPPMRSYEPNIKNCELFAFAWQSRKLQMEMYLKFVIKEEDFYYVSLHKSRKKERVKI